MSTNCTDWAYRQAIPDVSCKFVLVTLADHAGRDGIAWPGTARLVEMTGLGERQVRRWLTWLEENSYLSRVRRRTKGGRLGTYEYRLTIDAATAATGVPRPETTDSTTGHGRPVDQRTCTTGGETAPADMHDRTTGHGRPVDQRTPTSGLVITEPSEDLEPSLNPLAGTASLVPAEVVELGVLPAEHDVPTIRHNTGHEPADRIIVALVRACGYRWSEATATTRRLLGVVATELVRLKAADADVADRAANYRRHFPHASLTPTALAKHWAHCANPPVGNAIPMRGPEAARALLAKHSASDPRRIS